MSSAKRPADWDSAWLDDPDKFLIQQAYRKAHVRVEAGRAKPVDALAITLWLVEGTKDPLDPDLSESELGVPEPEDVINSLDVELLQELENDLDVFTNLNKGLKTGTTGRIFWDAVASLSKIAREQLQGAHKAPPGAPSVAHDIGRLFKNKTYDELATLESQINAKLHSDEAVDLDYWGSVLDDVMIRKAKAFLRMVSGKAAEPKIDNFRMQQSLAAQHARNKLRRTQDGQSDATSANGAGPQELSTQSDPNPSTQMILKDEVSAIDERIWLKKLVSDREKVLKLGYVPLKTCTKETFLNFGWKPTNSSSLDHDPFFDPAQPDKYSSRNIEELELGPEELKKLSIAQDLSLEKPKYWGRELNGFEWNKYNQLHYHSEELPPKTALGYQFNIDYPLLKNVRKAPTFKIIRNRDPKRVQFTTGMPVHNTCVILFKSGPPYRDIAFRIIDREWDYSARRDRGYGGYNSDFNDSTLRLYFWFRRMFYRK